METGFERTSSYAWTRVGAEAQIAAEIRKITERLSKEGKEVTSIQQEQPHNSAAGWTIHANIAWVKRDEPATNVQTQSEPVVSINPNATVDSLLKRAYMFLEDEEWNKADAYFDNVLDQEPENAKAYLGKLLSELKLTSVEGLSSIDFDISDNKYYKKVLKFGDDVLVNEVLGLIESATNQSIQRAEDTKTLTMSIANILSKRFDVDNSNADSEGELSLSKIIEEFKNNPQLIDNIKTEYPEVSPYIDIITAKEGEEVTFGEYIQNEKEKTPITWIVISALGPQYKMLVSKRVLDCIPYNESGKKASWEGSSLREWLNSTFYKTAFNEKEKALLGSFKDNGDKVSLLDKKTASLAFPNQGNSFSDLAGVKNDKLVCYGTNYATRSFVLSGPQVCYWWLKSDETSNKAPMVMLSGGFIDKKVDKTKVGVRPFIILDFNR